VTWRAGRPRWSFVPGALVMALVASACGFGGGSSAEPTDLERPGPSSSVSRSPFPPPVTPETPVPPTTPTPTATPTEEPTEAPSEPELSCPRRALLGVYSPQRLHVLRACQWFVGFVAHIVRLPDGDVRFDMVPARGYERLLNAVNISVQHGQFVAVMIYGQPMQFIRPSIGERIAVFGTWVRNLGGGWNEMHPVWEVQYPDSGTTIYAIPPDPPLHRP
jgi:hypothetical protein